MRMIVHPQKPEKIIFPEPDEETLVLDKRGTVRPSEQVEQKLMSLLSTATLPVSQMQSHQLRRRHEG